jgi:S1-C subfamily serine protease
MMNRRSILIRLLLAAPALAGAAAPEQSVVQVIATCQGVDPSMPWRREAPTIRAGFGVVVGPDRVLTTEDLVRDQVMVELKRPRSGAKIPARVVQSDYQVGAALLACDAAQALAACSPAEIAALAPTNGDVAIVQFDDTGQIQIDQGRVMELQVAPLPESPAMTLQLRVLANLNTGDRGAPVFYGDKVAGLVLRLDRGSQTCRVLPSSVLHRFLADAAGPTYRGVAAAGFAWTPLVDPVRRAFYGMAPDSGGVEVLRILPLGSVHGILQPGDIVLRWDGKDLDPQGFYTDDDYGRLLLPYLIGGRRQPGDSVSLAVWRAGKQMTFTLPLKRQGDADALIPENVGQGQPDYLVENGLVLREFGADYLRAHGERWINQANPRLVHLYLTRAQSPEQPGDRVVIIPGILPDEINVGYQDIHEAIVTAVNGEPIHNLADVFRLVDRDGGLRRVSLQHVGPDLVFDTSLREAANRRVAETYRIPALRYRRAAAASAP